jgi:hypothetical protein
MTQKQLKRRAENRKYYLNVRARGLAMTSFMMPLALVPEVRQYIKTRSQELVLNK